MIIIHHKGNFNKIEKFLNRALKPNYLEILANYGQQGVDALSMATPKDTGITSYTWGYEVGRTNKGLTLTWTNANVVDGVPIVILLQYGHATRNGGFVQGYDFINPAIRPIFDQISNELWKEVIA